MLLQFTVGNYGCFRAPTTLSFVASGDYARVGPVTPVPGVGDVLRAVVVFGANASGKTTLLDALESLLHLMAVGIKPGFQSNRPRHALDPDCADAPQTYQVDFFTSDKVWSYGLSMNPAREVVEEWLVELRGEDEVVAFRRKPGPKGVPRVQFGDAVEVTAGRRSFLAFVAEGTRPEQTLCAELRQRNAHEFQFLFDFALGVELIGPPNLSEEELLAQLLRDPASRAITEGLLRQAGTGVVGVEIEALNKQVARVLEADELVDRTVAERLVPHARLWFSHRGTHGPERLRYSDLSRGTQRLLHLVEPAIDGALGVTRLFLIDELDQSLHPSLVRWLVRQFLEMEGAQFLFTTHDTTLLDAGVFDRSGVWFVEKDATGASALHSLVDVDPAQLEQLTSRLGLGYLQGRFGGTPHIGASSG